MRISSACIIVLLIAPVKAGADIVNFTGLETGSNLEATQTGGTFSIQTSVVKTGTYALRVNPNNNATGFFDIRGFNAGGVQSSINGSTITTSFQYRYATKPSALSEIMLSAEDASVNKFELRINSGGNLVAYDRSAVALATGTAVLSADTWYEIQAKTGSGPAGVFEVYVDGVLDITTTGDLLSTAYRTVIFGKSTNRHGNSVDFFYDDIIINDTPDYPSSGEVKVMLPDANGAAQTFTIGAGSDHYTAVNEIPPDGNTSYLVSTLNIGDAETESLQDSGTVGITGTVHVVKVVNSCIRDGAANGTLRTRLRSGSTNSDTAGAAIGVAYEARSNLSETDPATAAAWTVSALDSVESGAVESETTDKSRMTFTSVMVYYTPEEAAAAVSPAAVLYKSIFHKAFIP